MRLCPPAVALLCLVVIPAIAQGPRQPLTPEEAKALIEKRESIEKQLEDIAKLKMPDLTAGDLEAAVRTIAGSARSMGVDVEAL